MARKERLRSHLAERNELQDKVINYFNAHPDGIFNYRQVSSGIGVVNARQRALVVEILELLSLDGFISEVGRGRYRSVMRATVASGTFIRRGNGKNSVLLDDGSSPEPIMIAERNSMHALNGDKVTVHISAARSGVEPEAKVISIDKRKPQTFAGVLHVKQYYAQMATDSKFLATDIFIPLDKLKGGKTGDKAVVRIVEWPVDANSPIGEVVDILGPAGDNDAEIHAILAEYGLPYKYPANVERAAQKIEPGITPEEVARRRDMREITTFTIDPEDAKDFDDALSIRKLDNGHWEIGVHIADVTHYVKPGSIIDKEAYARATSVYLVDRTVPMLPERLCNFICSLRENEDKLTHSVILEMDEQANVVRHSIEHTVTRSNRRFSYEQAQAILDSGEGELASELSILNELAKKLREARFKNGSLEFDRIEKSFVTDEKGHPTDVVLHEAKDANKLIEEFMLLANRKAAEAYGKAAGKKKGKTMVYRVHGEPDIEKLQNLAEVAAQFRHKLKTKGSMRAVNRSLNHLLAEIKGKPEEELLSLLAIKAQAKAVYSSDNLGHYGLAFDFYTHFTSPIRRYPDIMVHRLLDRYADGKRSVNAEKLEEDCLHCSEREQLAVNAERASIKYKEVEYMGDRLGGVFTGKISGVTEWGIYVELDESHCEGMIPMKDLTNDFYEFDEKNYLLRGRRTRHTYRLGDKIKIQVARADLIKRQLDFVPVDSNNPPFSHRIEREPVTEGQRVSRMKSLYKPFGDRGKDAKGKKSKKEKKGHNANAYKGKGRGKNNKPSKSKNNPRKRAK